MEFLASLVPNWLIEWLRIYALPFFKLQFRVILRALFLGVTDTILFISLPITITIGSQNVWNARYHLTTTQQAQIEHWANTAQMIAYVEDVPPVVPLVLWYKEGGLQALNPDNCEGIMGLYTAVSSGEIPCFSPGEIDAREIIEQLHLGARTFKEHCPEISYTTVNPNVIKRCYLAYNAGPNSRTPPNSSAYVMNGYDDQHQNMIHTDIQGRQYKLTALGAWPTHISMQAQLAQSGKASAPMFILAPAMLAQELIDKVWTSQADRKRPSDVVLTPNATPTMCRASKVFECFITPYTSGDANLHPRLSPLQIGPLQSSALTCGLLPGLDLTPPKQSVVLAPMPGYLTRYTDSKGHLAVQIENAEWTVWITGMRSYTAPEGDLEAGKTIGVIGGADSQTPAIHYTVYDKTNDGFVDGLSFVPATACPASN